MTGTNRNSNSNVTQILCHFPYLPSVFSTPAPRKLLEKNKQNTQPYYRSHHPFSIKLFPMLILLLKILLISWQISPTTTIVSIFPLLKPPNANNYYNHFQQITPPPTC